MKDSFSIQNWRFKLMMEALEKETQEQIDGLLPKIKRLDFSYTDFGALYKIRMYGEDGKELYIVNDPDDMFGWDRLNADGAKYLAKKLGIRVTDEFASRFYNYDYYQSIIDDFKNKGIELTHDDVMDTS